MTEMRSLDDQPVVIIANCQVGTERYRTRKFGSVLYCHMASGKITISVLYQKCKILAVHTNYIHEFGHRKPLKSEWAINGSPYLSPSTSELGSQYFQIEFSVFTQPNDYS